LLTRQAEEIDEQIGQMTHTISSLVEENVHKKQVCANFDKCLGKGNKNKSCLTHRTTKQCPYEESKIVNKLNFFSFQSNLKQAIYGFWQKPGSRSNSTTNTNG
jgi:hypothetical protein